MVQTKKKENGEGGQVRFGEKGGKGGKDQKKPSNKRNSCWEKTLSSFPVLNNLHNKTRDKKGGGGRKERNRREQKEGGRDDGV